MICGAASADSLSAYQFMMAPPLPIEVFLSNEVPLIFRTAGAAAKALYTAPAYPDASFSMKSEFKISADESIFARAPPLSALLDVNVHPLSRRICAVSSLHTRFATAPPLTA